MVGPGGDVYASIVKDPRRDPRLEAASARLQGDKRLQGAPAGSLQMDARLQGAPGGSLHRPPAPVDNRAQSPYNKQSADLGKPK